jgi:hypothetical protein
MVPFATMRIIEKRRFYRLAEFASVMVLPSVFLADLFFTVYALLLGMAFFYETAVVATMALLMVLLRLITILKSDRGLRLALRSVSLGCGLVAAVTWLPVPFEARKAVMALASHLWFGVALSSLGVFCWRRLESSR